MQGQRVLRTVVLTDAAGYTEKMRANEPLAIAVMQKDLHILLQCIEENGGQLIKNTGDGTMSVFTSSASAVRASLAAQERLTGSEFKHRIAVHAGEITLVNGDAFGDVINVCSRLEASTLPGTIRASKMVIDLIQAQALVEPNYLGKTHIKGISEPIEVFAWGEESPISQEKRRSKFLPVAIVLALVAVSVVAWMLLRPVDEYQGAGSPRAARVSKNLSAQNEAPDIDAFLNEAYDQVLQEVDEYEHRKDLAKQSLAIDPLLTWLKQQPMGKRERGQREIEHWELIKAVIDQGRKNKGSNATLEQMCIQAEKSGDAMLKIAVRAVREEFPNILEIE